MQLILTLFSQLMALAVMINKFISKAKSLIFPDIQWVNVSYLYKFNDLEAKALNSFMWKSFKNSIRKVYFDGMYSTHLDHLVKLKRSLFDLFLPLVTEEIWFSKFEICSQAFVKIIESSRNTKRLWLNSINITLDTPVQFNLTNGNPWVF